MTQRPHHRLLAIGCLCAAVALGGISGCSSNAGGASSPNPAPAASSNGGDTGASDPAGGADPAGASNPAGAGVPAGAGAIPGQPDTNAICAKMPIADGQVLLRPKLTAAVPDPRLGGCSFGVPGNDIGGSNLNVGFEVGAEAASRYKDDVNGTFTVGGTTTKTGLAVTTPLSGVGDKAVWDATTGYPTVSALKGDVYCTVSTTDYATQLTIIGAADKPLPVGTKTQQEQYAKDEGKLCTDLFGLVH